MQVCNVSLPNQDAMIDSSKFEAAENDGKVDDSLTFESEAGGYGGNEAKIVMTQKIPHVGEVNRFNRFFCKQALGRESVPRISRL